MAEQFSQAADDRQPQAQPAAALAGGVVELMILFEDRLKFALGDSGPGIADFDSQHSRVPAATEQDFAVPGVFQRIGEKVAEHLLEQPNIAIDRQAATDDAKGKLVCLGVIGKLIPQPVKQLVDRKASPG